MYCVEHVKELIAESVIDAHFDDTFDDEQAVKEFVLLSLHLDVLYAS